MPVNLSGKLPRDVANGMGAIGAALVNHPDQVHVIIALIDCSKITTDTDTGEIMPTARIRAVEAFADKTADASEVKRLWRRAMERRTKQVDDEQTELPLDLERAIDEIDAEIAEESEDTAADPEEGQG